MDSKPISASWQLLCLLRSPAKPMAPVGKGTQAQLGHSAQSGELGLSILTGPGHMPGELCSQRAWLAEISTKSRPGLAPCFCGSPY